jgi:hypothetical protein
VTAKPWVLSKMWGADTVDVLDALLNLAPDNGFDDEPGWASLNPVRFEQHIARSSLKSRLIEPGSAERVMCTDPGCGDTGHAGGFAGR